MTDASSAPAISPAAFDAVIFDLDGVVTDTARTHAAAWKQLFDTYLRQRCGEDVRPFDARDDYLRHVDGKPRYDGVADFLASRGIDLPRGEPDDGPDRETVSGLGNRKNALFLERLEQDGVTVFGGTIAFIGAARALGIRTAIISSSENCAAVLQAAGVTQLFDAKVDGVDMAAWGLPGKPAPDIFLAAARALDVSPARAVVVEDSLAGVEAGRSGGFGRVIGIDRAGQADALRQAGADQVVRDMEDVAVEMADKAIGLSPGIPRAFDRLDEIRARRGGRRIALFLDYDGTLTPIVETPDKAVLSDEMRDILRRLSGLCTTAVVSGRDLADVRGRVGIGDIVYAGSHGFDIGGPDQAQMEYQEGKAFIPTLDQAERALHERLDAIAGALVERKKFSIAVHYRNVAANQADAMARAVDEVLAMHPGLRKGLGKKVFELQPKIDWHKGKAVLWLLDALGLDEDTVLPVYIGDDVTDEDAFRALKESGIGIVVMERERPTAAHYALRDPDEVRTFLTALADELQPGPS